MSKVFDLVGVETLNYNKSDSKMLINFFIILLYL